MLEIGRSRTGENASPHPRPLRIGVLIPAYNEQANLPKLLAFLRTYRTASVHSPLDVQVWVDVSGSTDDTPLIAEEAARRWPEVHVINTGRRDGLIRALDRMLRAASGDLFLRMDADVSLTSDTLDRLISAIDRTGASIVGPRIVPSPSPSPLVTRLSRAEYALHHQVAVREAKTTLVQLFQGVPVHLRLDSPTDDQELQCQLTMLQGPAAYAGDAVITIAPPTNVRNFLFQRVRTIQHINMHRRRGYARSSTDTVGNVGPAIIEELRSGSGPLDLLAFLAVEALARTYARALSLFGSEAPFEWRQITDTKAPLWAGAEDGAGLTRPSEEPMPLLSR